MSDLTRIPEPPDGDERSILLGWLAFHRNALEATCAGLDAARLVERPRRRPAALAMIMTLTSGHAGPGPRVATRTS